MTDSKTQILHFTIGPVQGFIEDARRTRDFWAGSFLLSWLSGHAMAAVDGAGGKMIFPDVENDELFKAIIGKNGEPYIGSLPNRFKAEVPNNFDVNLCKDAVIDNWKELSEKIYKKFIKGDVAQLGNGGEKAVRAIWDRQVNNFWDINWVIGDKKNDDGRWLDQRKNWRTHLKSDEGGDLCRLMGHYQELSGFHRIGSKDKQQDFWEALRQREYSHSPTNQNRRLLTLNISKDERLCAVALIKRLFPLMVKDVIGWNPGGDKLNIINWPSVSYIAAVPWLKAVSEESSKAYAEIVNTSINPGFKGEIETHLFDLPNEGIFDLDGHLLHKDGIMAWSQDQLTKEDSCKNLIGGLKNIKDDVGDYASEFYAVLIMDGDRIGAKINTHEGTIKNGLAEFTKSVKEYFDPNHDNKNPSNGVLIYAGGDDVLAFVPLDTAIESAIELRKRYKDAFENAIKNNSTENGKLEDFTMSGAIIFAQYKIPLRAVLKKSHYYIDEIAKDRNGRDSLAIAVMKPGGIAFDWVSCWGRDEVDPILTLDFISKNRENYSSSFFYNVRERYAPLFDNYDPDNGDRGVSTIFSTDNDLVKSILTAEYKKQFSDEKLKTMNVEQSIDRLMQIGKPWITKDKICQQSDQYNFDGVLVARFLSVEGRWHLNKKHGNDK